MGAARVYMGGNLRKLRAGLRVSHAAMPTPMPTPIGIPARGCTPINLNTSIFGLSLSFHDDPNRLRV